MKQTHFLLLFLLLSVLLIFLASNHIYADIQTDLDVSEMTITFHETDATAEIKYNVGALTHIYIFFFGSRNLDPFIEDFLVGFPDHEIKSVNSNTSVVELYNASRVSGVYYLHDSCPLRSPVDLLTLVYPDGRTKTFENVTETPNTFY
ncbi:hypothetical protein [Methanolapillus ohkumae]|uniref:Uncharacterized protein n=1 Tax=Methanolapillus ohkumae TaxID=3028298 RepID=A0AA96ZVF9_9EURY|nr:hypothetical protein MsAm2_05720 [Methanosarcinaceae archaeon Am2]